MRRGGLPGPLPAGERLLWQGAPEWRGLALRALHVRGIAVYFALLLVWYAGSSLKSGTPAASVALSTLEFAGLAAIPVGLLALFAWLTARATVYTITSRRVAIRFGLALPMTVNLPFSKIEAADLHVNADGSGDIALRLVPTERIAYPLMWPLARPWRLLRTEPMLRAVPQAAAAAQILARALAASAAVPISVAAEGRQTVTQPHAVAAV